MPLTVIELGTGKASAITREFLKIVRPDNFVMVDESEDSLLATGFMVKNEFPEINLYYRLADFYKDDIVRRDVFRRDPDAPMKKGAMPDLKIVHEDIPQTGARMIVQFGHTLGNREAFIDGPPPRDSVIADMSHIRSTMMNHGDIAIYGLDMNPDMSDVLRGYKSEINEELVMGVLKKMKDELETQNFDPDNFSFTQLTNSRTRFFGQGVVANKTHPFMLGKNEIRIQASEAFSMANSVRFSQSFLSEVYPLTRQRLIKVLPHPSGRMHLQVLKAI